MIRVGHISTTYGQEGKLKVLPLTDDPKRFEKLKVVFLETPIGYEKLHIKELEYQDGNIIILLEEIKDQSTAYNLRNFYLCIPQSEVIPLPENHYFIFQIIGLKVYEGEKFLGIVEEVLQTGSNDVYVVKKDKQDVLIPALKSIVKKIDLKQKKMLVKLPEGLID